MEETYTETFCPICAGPGEYLGPLGDLVHYSCRNCGIGFHINAPEDHDDAPETDPDPNINRESKYFEIFARRDPGVGIHDVYEKVTFESGLVFENTEDLEESRQQLTRAFTEIYGGFVPVILFDFEPHEYYKPDGGVFVDDFVKPYTDLPFDAGELLILLESARLAIADEEVMTQVMEKCGESYNDMIDLHDKLIGCLEDDIDPADQWFAVVAIEKGENGRELAINKPDTLSTAVNIAEEYNNGNHNYEKIIVRRQPDQEIVWDSTEQ